MASPSPSPTNPSAPDSGNKASAAAATAPPWAKPPPATWSHPETAYLIQIYQDKWFANNRFTLKAPHWDEIAALIAARFGASGGGLPDKTPTQCRHKIEKLRKRFRTLRHRRGGSAGWPFYDLIDRLERGPDPIAQPAVPLRTVKSRGHSLDYDDDYYRDEDEDNGYVGVDDNCDEDDKPGNYSRVRSMDYILRRPSKVGRFPSNSRAVPRDDRAANVNTVREEEMTLDSELAKEIRAFAATYVGVEKAKMEMFEEAERRRTEMENKRLKMILEAQKQLVKVIANAFSQPQKGTTVADKESAKN